MGIRRLLEGGRVEFFFVSFGHTYTTQACAHSHVHAHGNTGEARVNESAVGPAMSCVFLRTGTCTRVWFVVCGPRRVYTRAGGGNGNLVFRAMGGGGAVKQMF